MATVTGFTAERMLVIENETVIDGEVVGDNLHLIQRAGVVIDAGNVRGAKGDTGAKGDPGTNGTNGKDGLGVPAGGAVGQLLAKRTATDNDTLWKDNWVNVPAPVTTGALVSWTDPSGELWVAKPGVFGGAYKRARDVLHCTRHRTASFTVPTTAGQPLNFETVDYDPYGLFVPSLYRVPFNGIYRADCALAIGATATGQWGQALVQINSANVTYGMAHGSMGVWVLASGFFTGPLVAGDTIGFVALASVALNGNTALSNTHMNVSYVGSG